MLCIVRKLKTQSFEWCMTFDFSQLFTSYKQLYLVISIKKWHTLENVMNKTNIDLCESDTSTITPQHLYNFNLIYKDFFFLLPS